MRNARFRREWCSKVRIYGRQHLNCGFTDKTFDLGHLSCEYEIGASSFWAMVRREVLLDKTHQHVSGAIHLPCEIHHLLVLCNLPLSCDWAKPCDHCHRE